MAESEYQKGSDSSDDSGFSLEVHPTTGCLPGSCLKSQQEDYEDFMQVCEEEKSPGSEGVENGEANDLGHERHERREAESRTPSPPEDVTLSPSLLHELNYVPMRITRSMASLRNAFDRGLGLSCGDSTETKVKSGSKGKSGSRKKDGAKSKDDSTVALVVRKTGKRSASRGARSGWAKNVLLDQESRNLSETVCSNITIHPRKGRPCLSGKAVRVPLSEENGLNRCDSNSGQRGDSSGVTEGETIKATEKPDQLPGRGKPSGIGWVMCDDCSKWRCISSELADAIEVADARWTCRDNPNKKFADCSVPQEKTNAEINADLNISEASSSDEEDAAVDSKSRASWTSIRHNIFAHRRLKKLDDDESLICQCKLPHDGGPGCVDDCLNRMMNVECSPETCPCGERCTNQQFAKRMYAKVQLVKCGRKGYGLRMMEDAPKGTFIIEYVGEVLDISAFEQRQKDYSRQRQRHFYFMTLNSSEVIDACRKGNLGRFINHSCEPNCQTEKWCVNGEISIGLFAIRDLVRGEEITFNYNFERLYGAAAKRCRCGSSHCTGYIGARPLPGAVIETDSDSDLEPIMLKDDDEEESTSAAVFVQETVQQDSLSEAAIRASEQAPVAQEVTESVLQDSVQESVQDSVQSIQETKASETVTWDVPCSSKPPDKEKPIERKPPACRIKRAKSGRAKKVSSRGFTVSNKSETYRPLRPLHSEVEEKLDKLLNEKGGLIKKKDTPKQYLKLLVISTASGDASSEGASCSIRDLSLLLDAMMKTTSRNMLTEVIQKNGLQLLHNLVKQSRKSFNKIPILRKLLKVLELLASKDILKKKHMSCTPPRNGMESFVKSICELTRHDDAEVQLISRRFQKTYLSDVFDEDRYRGGDHRHWGSDRYSQKRELFGAKSEAKPLFKEDSNEQEAKRRRRISRWDERPSGNREEVTKSVYSASQQQKDDAADRNGPPGYTSSSSGGRLSQERCSSGQWDRQTDYYSRPDDGNSRQHQQPSGCGARPRPYVSSSQDYPPSRPPPQVHHPYQSGMHQLPPKYYSPQGSKFPPLNGCYNAPPAASPHPPISHRAHHPQFQPMGGYGFAQAPNATDEPPVPGL